MALFMLFQSRLGRFCGDGAEALVTYRIECPVGIGSMRKGCAIGMRVVHEETPITLVSATVLREMHGPDRLEDAV